MRWCWLLFFLPGTLAAQTSLLDAACDGSDALRGVLENGAATDTTNARGENALHRLFRCGLRADNPQHADSVALLIDAGVPLDAPDADGRTPLLAALANVANTPPQGANLYLDGASLLLARGARHAVSDNDGIQPLHLAAAEPDARLSRLLLARGADPAAADNAGYTPLWYALAADNNAPTFALLWQAQAAAPDDEVLQQLAEVAAQRGRHQALDLILQAAPALKLPGPAMTRTLANALWQGADPAQLARLVDAGAEASALQDADTRDLAWKLATLGRDDSLAWLVAQGWDINRPAAGGYPALYFADATAAARLLAQGASLDAPLPDTGGTLLVPTAVPPQLYQLAEAPRSQARSRVLLEAGYAPTVDAQGRSDLQLAVDTSDLWLVQQLLARQPPDSSTARALLLSALAQGRLPLIQALLRAAPADALDAALLNQYLLSERVDPLLVEALMVAGVSLATPPGRQQEPPLLLAARRQLWPVVETLLKYDADTDVMNAQGCTLRCYEWSMPEALQKRLNPSQGENWQPPSLAQAPGAFFALALSPLLGLWLAHVAWQLARRGSALRPLTRMLAAGLGGIVVGAGLFYQCDPCVIHGNEGQLALTALMAVSLWLLGAFLQWRRSKASQ